MNSPSNTSNGACSIGDFCSAGKMIVSLAKNRGRVMVVKETPLIAWYNPESQVIWLVLNPLRSSFLREDGHLECLIAHHNTHKPSCCLPNNPRCQEVSKYFIGSNPFRIISTNFLGKSIHKHLRQPPQQRKLPIEVNITVNVMEEIKLVGGFNPSEKYWSNWIISPSRVKTNNFLTTMQKTTVQHFHFGNMSIDMVNLKVANRIPCLVSRRI